MGKAKRGYYRKVVGQGRNLGPTPEEVERMMKRFEQDPEVDADELRVREELDRQMKKVGRR